MSDEPCPVCDAKTTAVWQLFRPSFDTIHGADGPGYPATAGRGWLGMPPFQCCAACGLVWSRVDPARLRAHVEKHGGELARQTFDEFDSGPLRDLPDNDVGREIAEKVARLDAAARGPKIGLVGLYRDLTGATWDRALKEARGWPLLKRSEKLRLLGWVEKKKGRVDDFDPEF